MVYNRDRGLSRKKPSKQRALLVQLVERRSPKPDVGGSSPPGRVEKRSKEGTRGIDGKKRSSQSTRRGEKPNK